MKIHIPWNREAGFGAISWDGTILFNESILDLLGLKREEIERCIFEEKEGAKKHNFNNFQRAENYACSSERGREVLFDRDQRFPLGNDVIRSPEVRAGTSQRLLKTTVATQVADIYDLSPRFDSVPLHNLADGDVGSHQVGFEGGF